MVKGELIGILGLTYAEDDGSVVAAAGIGATSFVGRTIAAAVFASAGVATATGVGRSTNAAVLVAAGVGALSGVGRSTNAAVFASAGAAVVSNVGRGTAASVLSAAGVASLRTNLILDSNMNSAAFWNVGANWTFSGGKANVNSASIVSITQDASLIEANVYRYQYVVSNYVSGGAQPRLVGGAVTATNGTASTANGLYSQDIAAPAGPTGISFRATSVPAQFSVDEIIVYDISVQSAQGASIAAAVFVSAGVATVADIGTGIRSGILIAAGLGSLSATGIPISVGSGVFASAGIATAVGVGRATAGAALASAGVGAMSGVGRSTAASAMVSAGLATVSQVGRGTAASVLVSAGLATMAGVGRSTQASVMASTGLAGVIHIGGPRTAGALVSAGLGAFSGIANPTFGGTMFSSAGVGAAAFFSGASNAYGIMSSSGGASVSFIRSPVPPTVVHKMTLTT